MIGASKRSVRSPVAALLLVGALLVGLVVAGCNSTVPASLGGTVTTVTPPLAPTSGPPQPAVPAASLPSVTLPPLTITPSTTPPPTTTTTTTTAAAPTGGQGPVFLGSAQVMATGAPITVTPRIVFFESGNQLLTISGPPTQVPAGVWTAVRPVVAVAPAGWTNASMNMLATGPYQEQDQKLTQESGSGGSVVTGPLHTAGSQILDAHGAPVTLRGVVLNGLESDPSAPQVTEQAVLEARAWGANVVRLPLGEQFWESWNCDYSPGYQANVNQVVNWITSLGMVALLDLNYNTVGGCLSGGPHNMADNQSPAFWKQVAAQYASNPLVAFDLYNEPHNISDAVWLNGGTTTDFYFPWQTYQAVGMQDLYDAVRSTGANNLVFISGNTWASTVPTSLVQGSNIVYAAHAYTCPTNAPPACSNTTPYDPAPLLGNWVGLSASAPVMVTEFGWPSQYDGTYNSNVISFANAKGWGWTAFTFEDTQNSTRWDLTSGWFENRTAEPALSGMPVLAALAGF